MWTTNYDLRTPYWVVVACELTDEGTPNREWVQVSEEYETEEEATARLNETKQYDRGLIRVVMTAEDCQKLKIS